MSIQRRNTLLGNLLLNTVSSAGIVQLGDHVQADLTSHAIAVQRAIPNFMDDEYRFASYSLFTRPILTLQTDVNVIFQSRSPVQEIRVGAVRALGVSSSSLLHAGCGGPLRAETRIKHIRHFNNRDIS